MRVTLINFQPEQVQNLKLLKLTKPTCSPESSSLPICKEGQLLLRRIYSPLSDKYHIKIRVLSILNVLEPSTAAAVEKCFLKPSSCCFYRVFQISWTAPAISTSSS